MAQVWCSLNATEKPETSTDHEVSPEPPQVCATALLALRSDTHTSGDLDHFCLFYFPAPNADGNKFLAKTKPVNWGHSITALLS